MHLRAAVRHYRCGAMRQGYLPVTENVCSAAQGQRGPQVHAVRNGLLSVASERFCHLGYDKTTVHDLAEAVGFSKAYFYKFFASKQAIGDAVASQCLAAITEAVATSISEAQSAAGKMRSFACALDGQTRSLWAQRHNLFDIISLAEGDDWPSWRTYAVGIDGFIRDIVVEGRRNGEFERKTALDEVCSGIMAALQIIMNPTMLRHPAAHRQAAVKDVAGLVLRSLKP